MLESGTPGRAPTAASLSTTVSVGDLLFVGKKTTLFGTGVNRVSAVLSLNQVNEILDKDTCILKKPKNKISRFWDIKRRQVFEEFNTALYDFVDSRTSGKTTGEDSGRIQQLRESLLLDASSYYANFHQAVPMLPQIDE